MAVGGRVSHDASAWCFFLVFCVTYAKVADAAVAALGLQVAAGEAYELGTKEGAGPGADQAAWEQLFASAK